MHLSTDEPTAHADKANMGERQTTKRYFVRLTDGAKRRLDFLAVDAGFGSTEEFGGALLTEAIDRLWRDFDPKKAPRKKK